MAEVDPPWSAFEKPTAGILSGFLPYFLLPKHQLDWNLVDLLPVGWDIDIAPEYIQLVWSEGKMRLNLLEGFGNAASGSGLIWRSLKLLLSGMEEKLASLASW